jgi:glucosamine-6-phosphate deaminase
MRSPAKCGDNVEVLIFDEKESASQYAAKIFAKQIREKPDTVIGLATGSTPLLLYTELRRQHDEESLDFSGITSFNLDEYVGLDSDHPSSYRYFMQRALFDHVNMKSNRVHLPNGMSDDVPATCAGYEKSINAAGGIDLQVLGLGGDGHIGFNEPSSSLASRTRIKTLTHETREDNARFFESPADVPRHCITMGIGTIMEARQIVLLAFGERKAAAVQQVVEGPVSAMWPATILQMHPSVVVLLDEAAAANLSKKDYYKEVADNKPDWQKMAQ